MPDKSFDVFREKHPEYPEYFSALYAHNIVLEPDQVMCSQHGFYVDFDEPQDIDQLLAIARPQRIYVGTQELQDELLSCHPELASLVIPHSWYQDSIFMVMVIDKKRIPERNS